MRRDYVAVRRAQQFFAGLGSPIRDAPRHRDAQLDTFRGSVPVRVFSPVERRSPRVILFFHGGGWVIGSVDSYTRACTTMADLTGSPVWSVDYRLAPEHPYPVPLDDCFQAARAVMLDPGLIGADQPDDVVLLGDSAGANLAAVTSLRLRDQGIALPGAQVLFYPVVQTDHDPATSAFDSVREHENRWFPRAADVRSFVEMYAADARESWEVAPLHAPSLRHQPRTLLITADWDLLRDEGEEYGRQLAEAGNDVRIERIDRALHGFLSLPRVARPVSTAYDIVNDFLGSSEKLGS